MPTEEGECQFPTQVMCIPRFNMLMPTKYQTRLVSAIKMFVFVSTTLMEMKQFEK